MNISISVIVPVYNVEKYLRECLDSVLFQSLCNVEIICVEDGSTDQSLTILEAYSRENSTIRIIKHGQNFGLANSRNTGLDAANGEFVFFLDSDDLLYSRDSLETLHSIAVADGSDEVIGGMVTLDESTNEIGYGYHKLYLKKELRRVQYSEHLFLFENVVSCNKLINREFLLQNHIRFNSSLKKYEDNPFSCKVHLLAKSISLITESTYIHRIRKDSNNPSLTQEFNDDHIWHIKAGKKILDFLTTQNISKEVLFLHQNRMFIWLAMDLRQAQKAKYLVSEEEIFQTYYPVLAPIPNKPFTSMRQQMAVLIEALSKKSYDDAREVIFRTHSYWNNDFQKLTSLEDQPEVFITTDERCGGTSLTEIVRLIMQTHAIDDPYSDNWLSRSEEPDLPFMHAPKGDPADCLKLVYSNAGCIKNSSTLFPPTAYRPLITAVAQRGCRVVLLWRENVLQRAISLALAKRTKIYGNYDWTKEPRLTNYTELRVALDIDEIRNLVETYSERTSDIRSMLNDLAPDFLEIRYEDLFSTIKTTDEKLASLMDLCYFCEVDPEVLTSQRERLELILSPSQKMNSPELYRRMVTNIDTISEAFDEDLYGNLWEKY